MKYFCNFSGYHTSGFYFVFFHFLYIYLLSYFINYWQLSVLVLFDNISYVCGLFHARVNAGFEEHNVPVDVIWLDIEHTDGKR